MYKNVLESMKISHFYLYNPLLIIGGFSTLPEGTLAQRPLGHKSVWQNKKNTVHLAEKGGLE